MKTDAAASMFFAKMLQQNRMDCTPGGVKTSSTTGSGSDDNDTGGFDFRAVYRKIASTNARSHRITDANTLLQDRRREITDRETMDYNAASLVNGAIDPSDYSSRVSGRSDTVESGNRNSSSNDDGPASALEANRVISKALTEVSDRLHLKIDPRLKELSITSASKDTVKQLSEIMATLKNIAGLLDEAVAKNQKIDLGSSEVLDVSQSRELGAFIQSELFKVEIGIGMLGAGSQVRESLSQGMLPGGNIPQALDPAQITMSATHVQKVFGDMFTDPSSNLTLLAQKIRELCAEAQQSGAVNLNLTQGGAATTEGGPDFMFDGAIMRALLKIDGKACIAGENMAAAQNQKLNLLPGAVSLLNKDNALKGAMEQISLVDGSAKTGFGGSQMITSLDGKTQGTVYRTLDEAVMRQLAEKMNAALRTGANEIRIQLRPDSLGEVKLRIRMEGDVVFAKIQVENQQVKQVVENNMQFLKDSLSQQHLQAGSLDVSVGGEGFSSSGDPEVFHADTAGAQGSAEASEKKSGVEESATMTIGNETGRRFGDNTVEYFA
jgi:flagellar hook-length control protein FliK